MQDQNNYYLPSTTTSNIADSLYLSSNNNTNSINTSIVESSMSHGHLNQRPSLSPTNSELLTDSMLKEHGVIRSSRKSSAFSGPHMINNLTTTSPMQHMRKVILLGHDRKLSVGSQLAVQTNQLKLDSPQQHHQMINLEFLRSPVNSQVSAAMMASKDACGAPLFGELGSHSNRLSLAERTISLHKKCHSLSAVSVLQKQYQNKGLQDVLDFGNRRFDSFALPNNNTQNAVNGGHKKFSSLYGSFDQSIVEPTKNAMMTTFPNLLSIPLPNLEFDFSQQGSLLNSPNSTMDPALATPVGLGIHEMYQEPGQDPHFIGDMKMYAMPQFDTHQNHHQHGPNGSLGHQLDDDTASDVLDDDEYYNEEIFKKCEWIGCNLNFSNMKDLVEHVMGVHVGSGQSQYICRWIDCTRNEQPFSKRHKIQNHLRIHTGERPFVCTYPGCKKRFSRQDGLETHRKTHSNWKPFICSFPGCGKAYYHNRSLRKHEKLHGDNAFSTATPPMDLQVLMQPHQDLLTDAKDSTLLQHSNPFVNQHIAIDTSHPNSLVGVDSQTAFMNILQSQ